VNRRPIARVVLVLGALAALAALSACADADPDASAESARTAPMSERANGEDGEPSGPTSTTVTLPDPGVEDGTCELVPYTPPGAPEEQDGELCVPSGRHRDVGIVLVHGGGGKFGDHNGVGPWAERYTDDGYVTLAIDYHLFDTGDRQPVVPRPEQDVKAAVQFLRGNADALGLDPERIVVQGLSAGARLGAVALTTGHDPYFAGPSLWDGVPDHVNAFIGFYSTYDGTLEDDAFYYGGERDDEDPAVRRRWAKADSLANAANASGPAVLFTGDEDWNVLVTQMEQFVDTLDDVGLEGQATVAEDAEHGFDQADGDLTTGGEQALTALLWWLDSRFPQ
jgi:acetyl esterase/lipase